MTVRSGIVSAALGVAVLGVSFSGPLVRLSDAHPIAIAVWRLVFSLAIIAVPLVARRRWQQWTALDARGLTLACGGGVMLALHFWSWNTSVGMTTIAASTVLVNTQPVIVGILSALVLRERPSREQWLGIVIAMFGAAIVVAPDVGTSPAGPGTGRAAAGNALALVGGVTAALYYLAGRRLRAQLDVWAYAAFVYGACLVALLVLAALGDVPLGPFPAREYGIFVGLAIGPMLLGHTVLNWALAHRRAYQVNVVLLGEPIGATLLAFALPGIRERPGLLTLLGGMVVLAGIALAERRRAA